MAYLHYAHCSREGLEPEKYYILESLRHFPKGIYLFSCFRFAFQSIFCFVLKWFPAEYFNLIAPEIEYKLSASFKTTDSALYFSPIDNTCKGHSVPSMSRRIELYSEPRVFLKQLCFESENQFSLNFAHEYILIQK